VRRCAALSLAALPLVSACGARPAADTAGGAVVEDAGPRYFAEDEVDRPARPLAPIEPDYPPQLRALGVEGDVEARVMVLADGSVGGARLLASDDAAFTAAVREALDAARFEPAERAGRPVASWVTLRLRFRMEE
jgi:TonB family protein